jgi:hypothetical protein
MGHLINPISTRLGLSSFWTFAWSKFALTTFSYNLMLDNAIRNLILWMFSNSRIAVQMSIVGVFLSHFKIIRRSKYIRVHIYLILNSSIFLRSQSIEVDSSLVNFRSELKSAVNHFIVNALSFSLRERAETVNVVFKKLFSLFIAQLLKRNLNFFFKFNTHFFQYRVGFDISFIKRNKFVNANFLSKFIAKRLSFGFELNRVLNPIVVDLTKLVNSSFSKILGFKIACSGRFNKTQMASYSWEKYGPICLNTFALSVDYSFSSVFLKYGSCGIKIWLFSSLYPFQSFKTKVFNFISNKQLCNSLSQYNKNKPLSVTYFVVIKFVFKLFFLEALFTPQLLGEKRVDTDHCKFLLFALHFY